MLLNFTATILNWLKNHKKRIINNGNALALEVSKSLQYLRLNEAGIKTPKSIYCNNKDQIIKAADHFSNRLLLNTTELGEALGLNCLKTKMS